MPFGLLGPRDTSMQNKAGQANHEGTTMLADSTLEEFCRRSELSEQLIRLAWPSLAIESKLQLIDALGRQTNFPSFMADIAVTDSEEPIVRYWAASRLSLQFVREVPENSLSAAIGVRTDACLYACKERVTKDSSDLIRATGDWSATSWGKDLEKASQLQRLVYIRSGHVQLFESFVDFLERGIALGGANHENDAELAECLQEYLVSDDFSRELNRKAHPDPLGEHCNGMALKKLWSLANVAGRRLQGVIVFGAPLKLGTNRLSAADILTLSPTVLKLLTYDRRAPIAEAFGVISSNPDKFPADLVEEIRKANEDSMEILDFDDDLDISEQRFRALPAKGTAILETVSTLRRETHKAFEVIVDKLDSATAKRGFFG